MPRYKTVGFSHCSKKHANVFDIRLIADSPHEAERLSKMEASLAACMSCKGTPLRITRVMGVQEISLHMEYDVYGYTCDECGEKVEVVRVEKERSFTPPLEGAVRTCSRGHSRQILNQQFPSLERWTEKTS